jgi:hypothetical protein
MRASLGVTVGWVARRPRIELAGGYYHLFARGNERRAIYRDDNDRTSFLELLAEAAEGFLGDPQLLPDDQPLPPRHSAPPNPNLAAGGCQRLRRGRAACIGQVASA